VTEARPGTVRTFAYDEAGHVVENDRGGAEPVLGFVYDDAGRLARVDVDASPDTEYAVNAYGERVLKRPYGTPAAATHYHYGLDGTLLAESEADGDPAVESIVLPGGPPLAVIPDPLGAPAGIACVHPDHLGAAAAITDSGQDVDWELVAGPFGELEDPSGSLTYSPRFPGQYADAETGVRYNLMRDYDPSLGRYLQSDPIGLAGGLDTYAYVGGNPVNLTDPTGEFAPVLAIGGGLVLGGAAAIGMMALLPDIPGPPLPPLALGDLPLAGQICLLFPAALGALAHSPGILLNEGAGDEAGPGSEVAGGGPFTSDQQAAIELAKQAKQAGGLTEAEAKALVDQARSTGLKARGPENHVGRPFSGPHIHVGPISVRLRMGIPMGLRS
jgi:RHS repeat-associated protein